MAHLFESGLFVGQPAWHGLGVLLDNAPSAEDALKISGLDWQVKQMPLKTRLSVDDIDTAIESHVANVRSSDNTILGIVGKGYKPLNNADIFAFIDTFVKNDVLTIDAAGSLKNGKTVWLLCKLKNMTRDIVSGDAVNSYFLVTNGHDGFRSCEVKFTDIRVVCNNTLVISDKDIGLKMRHTAKMDISAISDVVNFASKQFDITTEKYKQLVKKGFTSTSIVKLCKDLFYDQKTELTDRQIKNLTDKVESITRLVETGQGSDISAIKGTNWALYNAVTEYLNFEASGKADDRVTSLWLGKNKDISNQCLDILLAA